MRYAACIVDMDVKELKAAQEPNAPVLSMSTSHSQLGGMLPVSVQSVRNEVGTIGTQRNMAKQKLSVLLDSSCTGRLVSA